ncbi:hypothetical protein [Burkholderia ubonensis]|uniref:hypothetical protein n=1 Tax=Burkholderia ubonensis TaxID=101571 RepID=UPI001582D6D4|nr:hypothetical protein [Burkholderia ubonensis]
MAPFPHASFPAPRHETVRQRPAASRPDPIDPDAPQGQRRPAAPLPLLGGRSEYQRRIVRCDFLPQLSRLLWNRNIHSNKFEIDMQPARLASGLMFLPADNQPPPCTGPPDGRIPAMRDAQIGIAGLPPFTNFSLLIYTQNKNQNHQKTYI